VAAGVECRGEMGGGWVVGARAYVACVEGRSVFGGWKMIDGGVFFMVGFEDF